MPTVAHSPYTPHWSGFSAQVPLPPPTMPTYVPATPYPNYPTYVSPYPMPFPSPWTAVNPNYSRRQAWESVKKSAERKAKEAEEQERREREKREREEREREEREREEREKRERERKEREKKEQDEREATRRKQEEDSILAFWAARGFPRTPRTHTRAPSVGLSPKVVNVNIENLQHGVFGHPSPPTCPQDIPPFVPQVSFTAPTPPIVNLASCPAIPEPTPTCPADPWSSGKTCPGKDVVDVSALIACRHPTEIQINPCISSRFGPPALEADLCTSIDAIRLTDGDKKWKGLDQSLTLPMLSSVVVVSPYFPQPMVVSNPSGVTVGDFLTQLYGWAHAPLPSSTIASITPEAQTFVEHTGYSLRQPFHPTSVISPHISWIDLLFGHTIVQGLRQDRGAARQVLGWDHPACFVVDLERGMRADMIPGVSATQMNVGTGRYSVPGRR